MLRESTATYSTKKRYRLNKPLLWVKITNYEYWPFWVLFFPSILYGLFLALKARSLTYFTAANPGIELGGFFGESKIGILNKVDSQYLPQTLFFEEPPQTSEVIKQMNDSNISFPIICKPDKGERGFNVEKINNETDLIKYLSSFRGELIIQEFVDYEIELGVLYYRMPDNSESGITSVVKKDFLSVTGDGNSTVGELIGRSDRARFQQQRLKEQLHLQYDSVVPGGEKVILERIGNHCRGTMFLNGSPLINDKLITVFDKISSTMDGFYFGRFDLKVKSIEDLYNGANIKIMEVNGTTSEPAHIYDPEMNFIGAQKSILFHTHLVYKIARLNHANGHEYTPFGEALQIVRRHFKSRKENAA